ncbi:uncharacterized protein [Diabrotica undecimpunctata]|uniref:uncharacterized protein n=1 Tax=Diabrotica undecimpunctata TaxID=50387 RepID=UPI003B63DC29
MASNRLKTLKILQVNIGRAKVAHDLIYAKALAINADLIIVPEPNVNIVKKFGWITDTRSDVAIYLMNKRVQIRKITKKEGFVKVNMNDVSIIACYISPNINITLYREKVENIIEASLREKHFIIVGDINAKSILWGSPRNDNKGEIWNEWISTADLVVLNNGKHTFERGVSRSHIDVTLASNHYANKINNWDVLEDNIFTFHKYITFEIGTKVTPGNGRRTLVFNKVRVTENIRNLQEEATDFPTFRNAIIRAHRLSSKSKYVTYTVPYWWNDEIQLKRAECLRIRRIAQRERTQQTKEEYKSAKQELNKMIKRAKRTCWKNLCEALENDVWGQAYKIATKTLRSEIPYDLCHDKRREIVCTLFPTKQITPFIQNEQICPAGISTAEFTRAAESIKIGKSPRPDRVPLTSLID